MPSARSLGSWVRDATPRQWLKRLAIAALGGAALLVVLFLLAYAAMSLPAEPAQLQTSQIKATDGSTIGELYKDQNRVDVKLAQVARVMQNAVVSTEDRRFYEHRGIDPVGFTRALVNDVRGRNVQGGSTITQQLVKNTYLTSERSLVRKAKEAVLAVKVERQFSKRQILERYLNTIYFGRGAYGVEKASKLYFNKDAADLDLPEAALLAGLIRAPESADPQRNPQAATDRRALVLRAMVRAGRVTQAQGDEAAKAPIEAVDRPDPTKTFTGSSAYFSAMVRQWAVDKFGERVAYGGGLQIETTLDPKRQSAADEAVRAILNRPDDPDVALVSMADDGAIVAMIGGRDFQRSQLNLAIPHRTNRPQAGSTFKPFVLAAALRNDIPVSQRYAGPSKRTVDFEGFPPYEVDNFEGESFGSIDLTDATAHSVNTVYAQLAADTGLRNVEETAHDLGVESKLPVVPSMSLGAANVAPEEMIRAYMTFATRGKRVEPYFVKQVTDSKGHVIFRAHPESTQVYDEGLADVVNHVLGQVIAKGTGRAASIGRPAAGKTGTTTSNTDAWFVGYTPKIGTAVWMGYAGDTTHKMNNVHGRAVTGGSFPAQIWARYMKAATRGVDTGTFHEPDPELLRARQRDLGHGTEPARESTTSTSSDESTTTTTDGQGTTTTTDGGGSTTTTERRATTTTAAPTTTTTAPSGNGNGNGKSP